MSPYVPPDLPPLLAAEGGHTSLVEMLVPVAQFALGVVLLGASAVSSANEIAGLPILSLSGITAVIAGAIGYGRLSGRVDEQGRRLDAEKATREKEGERIEKRIAELEEHIETELRWQRKALLALASAAGVDTSKLL